MTAFGKYQLMELIGAGGMAEVYLAKSFGAEGLEKLLVIKRIRREFATRPRFVSMFIDEAKIAVSLNHPNVVQVYEFGRVGEDYFLAMEYVEGTDLGKLMHAVSSHGAMVDPADAMYIAIETAKGLDYAHRKKDQYGQPLGIVHRDISPQNILISKDGGVKLVDFGIAKATVASDDSLGEVKGKLSYMSPEQARGLAVDQRSDVFSLGIVLWEILAGRTLFPFSSHAATLKLVKNSVVPPLAEMREDLPADLVAIVDSMLAKEAADRPASARDVQVALTKCLFASGTVADSVTLVELMDEYGENLMLSQELAIEATRFGIEGTLPPGMVDTTGVGATNPNSAHPTAVFQVTPFTDDFAVENVLGADLTDATGETDRAIDEQQRFYSGEIDAFRGPEERTERTENVLVCGDLRGFSALRERTTSERWRQVLLDYIRIVEAIAFKNSAVVDRVGEDGFTLILGLPVSSENDAERAMSLAQDVLEAVDAMGINLESQLQLSMGVVVGSVVVEYQHSDGLDGPQFDWSWDEESAGQGGFRSPRRWHARRCLARS